MATNKYICHCCKLEVSNSQTRHRCPHDVWCAAGYSDRALYTGRPLCKHCTNERRKEQGLPPLRKLVRSNHWHLSFFFLLLSCGPATKSLDCVAQFPYERSTHENCQLLNFCVPGQLCACKSQQTAAGCEIRCEGVNR